MPNHVALVVCPECYHHRYQGPVFAVDFKGADEEHELQCEFHGEITAAIVLAVLPKPEALR